MSVKQNVSIMWKTRRFVHNITNSKVNKNVMNVEKYVERVDNRKKSSDSA